MPANLKNSAVVTGLEKFSLHSNPEEGQCQRTFKLPWIALIPHASKAVLKILRARLQQYVNGELPDEQAGFRKGRRNRDQIAKHPSDHRKSKQFHKNIYFCFIDYPKTFDGVYHNKLLKILSESESCWVMSNSLQPHRLYSPWNSSAQNTGVGSLSFPQGIFPTQGSSPGLLHCRWVLYQLNHKGNPEKMGIMTTLPDWEICM